MGGRKSSRDLIRSVEVVVVVLRFFLELAHLELSVALATDAPEDGVALLRVRCLDGVLPYDTTEEGLFFGSSSPIPGRLESCLERLCLLVLLSVEVGASVVVLDVS